jgi:2-keto-4-pentenoate hydratase
MPDAFTDVPPQGARVFDPEPGAQMLAAAWRADTQLTEFPADIRPQSIGDGYDVQDRLMALLGERRAGWKLGAGSPKVMRAAHIDRALAGCVVASRCFGPDVRIRFPRGAKITIEFEIGFVLGRDIAPGTAPADPLEAVSDICFTSEIVRSRFVDRRAVGWPSFVADDSGFYALVVGPSMPKSAMATLCDNVVVTVDGREGARGCQGEDRTDPLASLRTLIAHAATRGITLRKGEIISSGSVSDPFDVAQESGHVVATAPGLTLGWHIDAR